MSRLFYRFRSAHNLLDGYSELEKQEIYFARPEQLNDPMEGFRHILWKGDSIAWKNLFGHYIFCLERVACSLLIAGETSPVNASHIPVFGSSDDLHTEQYKELYEKIRECFLEHDSIKSLITAISKRSTAIRREELLFYLDCMHAPALKIIFDIYIDKNLSPDRNRLGDDCFSSLNAVVDNDVIGVLEKSISDNDGEDSFVSILFSAKRNIKEQIDLINNYNETISSDTPNKNFVLNEFPSKYLSRLDEITFPPWYTACLMSDYRNSSVWGNYSVNHTGMCLVFEGEEANGSHYVKLNKISGAGSSGVSYSLSPMLLHPIKYGDGYGEIDFFRSIGRLSVNVMNEMWHYDENNNQSICADEISNDEDAWRMKYWDEFIRDISFKSKDWKYEKEYRLILHSNVFDLSDKDRRTLTYEFSSLKGIIFGIKTSQEDKLKAIKIIEQKCLENNVDDFKFYQAYYSPDNNCIEKAELNFIRFSDDGASRSS